MAEEFFSFEKALEKLKLREEELRRLVSEGEIRAYRSGETMKLRREDVEKLQKELSVPSSGEVIDVEGGTEELIFSDEESAEVITDEPGMETAQIAKEDTLVIETPEEISDEEAEELEPVTARTSAASRRSRRGATRVPATTAVAELNVEGSLNRFFLAATAVFLLLATFALINVANMDESAPLGFFKSLGSIFGS